MTNDTTKSKISNKKKGPLRWEALLPALLFFGLIYIYGYFFLDSQLKWAIEKVGYQIQGSEVNVGSLKTSFWNASMEIQNIQVTDAEVPSRNSIQIGSIRYQMSWDALLRARILIKEAAVEQISFHTARKSIGKVKPPEPIPPETSPEDSEKKLSAVKEQANKVAQTALQTVKKENPESIFQDLGTAFQGDQLKNQLEQLKDELPSKKMVEEFQVFLKDREKYWNEKSKTLPNDKDIKDFQKDFSLIKLKDFKSPQEVQESVQKFQELAKRSDQKIKSLQAASSEFDADWKSIESKYKAIDAQVKVDIQTLEKKLRLPQIDGKKIVQALFHQYADKYLQQIQHYQQLAQKYLPPGLLKKDPQAKEEEIKPHPRAKGISYEFGRPNSYPMFWIQRIGISSKAGVSPGAGDIAGEILNITSNQKLIGKPTELKIQGGFPDAGLLGLRIQSIFDGRKEKSLVRLDLKIDQLKMESKDLISSSDISIKMAKAVNKIDGHLQLQDLKEVELDVKNLFQQASFEVTAKNDQLQEILRHSFSQLPSITLDAEGKGNFPNISLNMNSNFGPEIQKQVEKEISSKVAEAKKKLDQYVQDQVGTQKAKVEQQVAELKKHFQGDLDKTQNQLNQQKTQSEGKVDQAKKDAEKKAKSQIENEVKKRFGDDGQKKLDDLKKKFGI
jgi:uncharacterized protein (TIGR03545 family)